MLNLLQSWLNKRLAPGVVIALATVLTLPALFTGWLSDDFIHAHVLTGSRELAGYHLPWWRLFQFAAPKTNGALFTDGILPWWADDKLQLSFFRPLSALTHWLDYTLWPNSAFLMHAQSLAWAMGALIAIWALYDLLLTPRWIAVLALALYASSSARAITVAWIANRNALIAAAFSMLAVVLYLRGQRGSRLARWVSPACLGLGLLAAEGAMGAGAYLVAGALCLEKGGVKKRVFSLLPHVAVIGICMATARLLGYGVVRSGEYLDPLNDSTGFLEALAERSLVSLFAAVGGPSAEWWNAYELIVPGLSTVFIVCAMLGLACVAWLLKPVVWQSASARFWLTGALLSLLPAAAAFPNGRVLTWISIGVMGLLAQLLASVIAGQERRGAFAVAGAYTIALLNLVVSPLCLPGQCWTVARVRAMLDKADSAVPTSPGIRERTVIYLNPPQDTFPSFTPVTRAMQGIARPRTQRWLATGLTAIDVKRIDPRTLELRPYLGFIREQTERVVRSLRHPFAVGDRVVLSGLTVEICELTADGRPARARFFFERPLEDPSYFWLVWNDDGYIPFTPPKVGATLTVPEVDFVSVLFGSQGQLSKFFKAIRNQCSKGVRL